MRFRPFRLVVPLVAAVLWLGSSAQAQTPDGYRLRLYASGAAAFTSETPFTPAEVSCNQVPPTTASANVVNPTVVVWDDAANAGKVCVYTPSGAATGPLLSLPSGLYEGVIVATLAGEVGPESNRAPFSRARPGVLTGVRFARRAP